MKTIDDIEIIEQIPPIFPSDAWVSVDLELFGAKKGKFHRPIGEFASLALTADGHTVYVITDKMYLGILDRTFEEHCGVIMQNAMFDIFHLRRWINFPPRENLHDTLLFDLILWNNYYEKFKLKDLARRYLGIYLEKETVEQFEKATALTSEMIRYNAIDAVVQWRVWQEQMKLAKKSHMHVWKDEELPAMWAFLDFKGVMLDTEAWAEMARRNEALSAEMKATFPFNPNAPGQVKAHLNKEYKLNLASTKEDFIEPYRNKYEIIDRLLTYRKIDKRRSTYGMNWIDQYVEPDGRVYSSWRTIGAETFRTAASEPTLMNLPARREDDKEYRRCFIAAPGYVFVGGDFSSQEPRCTAYLTGDDNLKAILDSGGDVYAGVASDIYEREVTRDDPLRDDTKSVYLGLVYGLSPFGLARDTGISQEEAEEKFALFFKKFPKVRIWMDNQRDRIDKFVWSPGRHKIWINQYSSQALRNALNGPHQCGGAEMLKVSLAYLHQRWDCRLEPFPVVLENHDEILMEVLEKNVDYAKDLLLKCMIEAGEYIIPGIPIVAKVKTGKTWLDVH